MTTTATSAAERSAPAVPARLDDPRLPLLLLPPSILVGLLAELSLVHAGVGPEGLLTDAASGYAYVLAGLTAWHRRPRNRSGRLMTGIGLAWFGGDFLFAPVPLLGPASFLSQAAARLLFAWLLLAFPSGRLESTLHRAAVATVGAMAGSYAVLQLVTLDPATLCACPSSPFAVAAGGPLEEHLGTAGVALNLAMTAILVPLVIRRMLVASGPLRRTLLPVLAGGIFSLLTVVPDLVGRLTGTAPEAFGWLPIVWVALPLGFLVALLRERMARGAVADLVISLGSTPQPEGFRDALSRALGDPDLQLLAWSPASRTFLTADGASVTLLEAPPGRAVSILDGDHGRIGAIVHDAHLLDDPGLVASVLAAARLAAENERLAAELEAQLAEVRASRARIVTAADAERRRLERDLHDGAQQRLVALSLALRRARARADGDGGAADEALAASLDEAAAMVKAALAELRELARGIHPAVLTEAGLAGAVRTLAAGSPVAVSVDAVPDRRLAPEVEAAAYFFVSEALANVAKHAPGATAHVRVERVEDALAVEVADDGPGGARTGGGTGLVGLGDRLAAVGGSIEIDSAPDRGTRLRARIPLPHAGEDWG